MMIESKPKFRVLVIEDNQADFTLVEDFLLEKLTAPIIINASNFKKASSILLQEKPEFDIILLDLSLPDKSGQTLLDEILILALDCPVIILTGYTDVDFSIKSISKGISDYMLKEDLTANSLYKSIVYSLERRKQLLQLKDSENRYSNLFHLSPQARWVYDPKTSHCLQVNRAAIDCYDYTEQEFLTMNIHELESVENAPVKKIQEANADGFLGRQKHYKKSGEPIDVEIYSNTIIINEIAYQSVLSIDISEKLLYEHQITRAIIKTQEDERYEIGAELHDNVCQILASCLMAFRMLKKSLDPEGMPLFTRSEEYILLASEEIRNLSHRLAPAFFSESTMEEAFQRVLNEFNAENKFKLCLYFGESVATTQINIDLQLNLYRILQEQLSNILKYSEATLIKVDVVVHNKKIKMHVSDNGVGFNVTSVTNGIGIANMKRRTELFFGKLDIQSSKGNGCDVIVEIPLQEVCIAC